MIAYPITISPPLYEGRKNNLSSLIIDVPFAWEDYTINWEDLNIWWNTSYVKIITARGGVLVLPTSKV